MELITFIAGAALATGITYGMKKKTSKQQETETPIDSHRIKLSTGLGLHAQTEAERIERNLAQAMDTTYFQAVKERIIRKNLLTEKEYDVYLLELKRYFFLTTIMKSVPMYNEKVDVIWHEMLMFTKSYDAFCAQFMGSKIHHEPNLNPTPNTEEKGLFSFVYTYFFQPHAATSSVYPDLQVQLLSKEFLHALEVREVDDLIFTYFAPTGDEQYQALRKMILTLKADIQVARKLKKRPVYMRTQPNQATNDHYYTTNDFLVYQMMSHSMIDIPEEKTVASTSSSYGSNSYTGSSRSHSSDDNASSSSSSKSSGSSCSSSSCSSSSCGSSCSS